RSAGGALCPGAAGRARGIGLRGDRVRLARHGTTAGEFDSRARLSRGDGGHGALCGARDFREPCRRSGTAGPRPEAAKLMPRRWPTTWRVRWAIALLAALVIGAVLVPLLAPTDPRAIGD